MASLSWSSIGSDVKASSRSGDSRSSPIPLAASSPKLPLTRKRCSWSNAISPASKRRDKTGLSCATAASMPTTGYASGLVNRYELRPHGSVGQYRRSGDDPHVSDVAVEQAQQIREDHHHYAD